MKDKAFEEMIMAKLEGREEGNGREGSPLKGANLGFSQEQPGGGGSSSSRVGGSVEQLIAQKLQIERALE